MDSLLEQAASLGERPGHAALRALGVELQKVAATLDLAQCAAMVTAEKPRVILGEHPDGPIVALRKYEAGEVSTVHAHAWTILLALCGGGALERWVADGSGNAKLVMAEATAAVPVVIDGFEPHHQRTTTGALELVVLGDYSDASPRVDFEPDAGSATFTDHFAGFLAAWQAADTGALAPFYADDVFLDLHVPKWRVQIEGKENVLAFVDAEEFQADYSVPRWSVSPTPTGWVLELQAHYTYKGSRAFSEMVHRVHLAEPGGPITSQSAYCTGIWDQKTIEGLGYSGGLQRP